MNKKVLAIDLHGTLIDHQWNFPDQLLKEFIIIHDQLKQFFDFYICTGNNLDFVIHYLPKPLISCFKGFILETGAVFSDGYDEEILISSDLIREIMELKNQIEAQNYSFIKYFANRSASISAFTRSEFEGESPEQYVKIIDDFVKKSNLSDKVYTTYSNVAIDIIPNGISKLTGIQSIAEKKFIISLLDSMNDVDLAIHSNICFLPSNASPDLLNIVPHQSINAFLPQLNEINQSETGNVFLCQKSYSYGVLEALRELTKVYN